MKPTNNILVLRKFHLAGSSAGPPPESRESGFCGRGTEGNEDVDEVDGFVVVADAVSSHVTESTDDKLRGTKYEIDFI